MSEQTLLHLIYTLTKLTFKIRKLIVTIYVSALISVFATEIFFIQSDEMSQLYDSVFVISVLN